MDNLVDAIEEIYSRYNIHCAVLLYSDRNEFQFLEKALAERDFPLNIRLHPIHIDDDYFYAPIDWATVNVVISISEEADDVAYQIIEKELPDPGAVLFFSL